MSEAKSTEPVFTPDQERAIQDGVPDFTTSPAQGAHNLLVSASAGSGKTAVLVERIRRQILAGGDVSRMLVVTFTNAAAAEMKAKIDRALKKYLTEHRHEMTDETRRHLTEQIGIVDSAPISTLDAFALQVVQQYYYVDNLDPNFRILADTTEALMIQETVWDDLREALYTGEPDAFGDLTRNFATGWHDDVLGDLILRIYTYAMTTTDPKGWISRLQQPYTASLDADSPFVNQLAMALAPTLQEAENLIVQAKEKTSAPDLAKWTDTLDQDLTYILTLESELGGDYGPLYATLSERKWPAWPRNKVADEGLKADKDDAKQQRDAAKKLIEKHVLPLVTLPANELLETLTGAGTVVAELSHVAELFRTHYAAEKKRRHVMDFGDIEQAALRILTKTNPDTGLSVGQAFREAFDVVLVDEYQDTNPLQEALLQAVSEETPGNRFMVGDVKQSIYGFRLADPSLFMAKYNTYAKADTTDPETFATQGEHVTLADNFRSSQNILDFTNLIFTQIMDKQLGAVNYTGAEQLQYGAKDYGDYRPDTELLLYAPEADDEGAKMDKDEAQVRLVANRIQTLMADPASQIFDRKLGEMRPIDYRDITLLEPTRSQNLLIQQVFADAGIPVVVNNAQNYFKTTELQVMLALLRVIDNPLQEIPLVAVLRSPIVGLTADELALIRITDKSVPYYDALATFQNQFEADTATPLATRTYEKVARFTTQLTHWRDLARTNQLVDLIWAIYADTGYLDFVGGLPGGRQRQANLHALYERAHSYEEGGFRGVFAFVHFIELMMKRDQDLAAPVVVDPNTNAVNLMTIHGSKGLQFPIVFLMNTSRQFRGGHGEGSVVLSSDGIGINWYDASRQMTVPTPQLGLATAAKAAAEQAENMRVLYVALTRAEQRLFVVGHTKDEETTINHWQTLASGTETVLPYAVRLDATSQLDLIGASLVRHPKFPGNTGTMTKSLMSDPTVFHVQFSKTVPIQTRQHAGNADVQPPLDIDVDNWLSFTYPHESATRTTVFQSVSEVKGAFDTDPAVRELNERTGATQQTWQNRATSTLATPEFMQVDDHLDNTAVGTATHALLHAIDLTQPVTADALQNTLRQLVTDGLVDQIVADRVKLANVARFFTTSLGQALQAHAADAKREAPFAMLVPAARLFKEMAGDDQNILIHGIMDGYFDAGTHMVLFDYKTDHIIPNQEQTVINRYTGQLALYAHALHAMTGKPVEAQLILLESPTSVHPVDLT